MSCVRLDLYEDNVLVDQVPTGVTETTTDGVHRNSFGSNTTSLSAEATVYHELESPADEKPLGPDSHASRHNSVRINSIGTSLVIPDAPLNISPSDTTQYSRLESPTREPPHVPGPYARLIEPNYANINEVDHTVMSGTIGHQCQDNSLIPGDVLPFSEVETMV